ncbi:M1 family metallopeptidase [Amnibacterium flavum]|uniref:Aminopeptidase N n=1 Tax=Amnibacterium flavum TaxID=2173173 RepID=A0A2V1HSX9_9MICO|nr:M1 family metallopeptidase [Amnibacterium flavum]PVZ95678.1 peptidase M1 [Amnibacterium flavum]
MDPCILPSTGFDPSLLLGLTAVAILGGGLSVWAARRRSKRSGVALAVPFLVLLLLAGSQVTPPAASAAVACPPAPAGAPATGGGTTAPVTFEPGSAGIGDPYYPLDGNGGYDVQNYDLDLAYDPATDVLAGTATIDLVATQNLSAFNLDFDTRDAAGADSIVIGDVRVDGASTAFSLASTQISLVTAQPVGDGSPDAVAEPPRTELTVMPATGILSGTELSVEVDYAGVPITIDDAFGLGGVLHTPDGMVPVGQPRAAAVWFPSNDHPADKATLTMSMTVPIGLDVIGNGVLASTVDNGPTSTWTYVMDRPMATYLATAVVGDYDVQTTTVDGVTYRDAVAQSLYSQGTLGADARTALDLNPDVIAYLSSIYGPYPFTESGGIAVDLPDLGYALENQTRPIYGFIDEPTVVHELAHQWYGDDVAIERWSDIWLNEAFATYSEWLWSEDHGGDTAQQIFDDTYSLDASDPFWSVEVADPGAPRLFDNATYYRGAMTLHALRLEVGDPVFFGILRGWAADNAGGNVSTAQFEAYASAAAGTDLSGFFDTWIHSSVKP